MAFLVQKFGGTSVGDLDRIRNVASKVKAARDQGHWLVVVVSAMGGETNRLVDLARSITPNPLPREMDVLL
ncbi:MAG: aspartate kinase, partial [Gammaproteobacteria bacterium]|nr:aspartate kinase [Gammaproteobacteria bacterium]